MTVKYPPKPQNSPIFCVQISNPENTDPRLFVDLNLPATEEEMIDALEFIGVSQPFETVIVSFESQIEGFEGLASEGTSLDLLDDLADQIDRMDEAEYIKYRAVLESEGVIPLQIKRDNEVALQKLVEYSYCLDEYHLSPSTGVPEQEQSQRMGGI